MGHLQQWSVSSSLWFRIISFFIPAVLLYFLVIFHLKFYYSVLMIVEMMRQYEFLFPRKITCFHFVNPFHIPNSHFQLLNVLKSKLKLSLIFPVDRCLITQYWWVRVSFQLRAAASRWRAVLPWLLPTVQVCDDYVGQYVYACVCAWVRVCVCVCVSVFGGGWVGVKLLCSPGWQNASCSISALSNSLTFHH